MEEQYFYVSHNELNFSFSDWKNLPVKSRKKFLSLCDEYQQYLKSQIK